MADKRMTLDELVGELSSGMTIGIGGWGSRRKPMAAVRAILRSDLTDLTVVSYGGPDVGLLCAAGKVAKVVFGFVTLDSIPTDPHFKTARQSGAVEAMEIDEGMLYLGLLAAWQEIWPIILRQRTEPKYQFVVELPSRQPAPQTA